MNTPVRERRRRSRGKTAIRLARRARGHGAADPAAAAWSVIAAAGARAARWPWWVQVGALYVAARLVSACIFMAAALHQGVNPWFPAKPDYWSFVNIWDARWYGEVLQNGYPEVLPTDEAGNVQENAWAFYALFPVLGRVVAGLTGMPPGGRADAHRPGGGAGCGTGHLQPLPAQGIAPHCALGDGVRRHFSGLSRAPGAVRRVAEPAPAGLRPAAGGGTPLPAARCPWLC